MDFHQYIKNELDNILFVEIGRDITFANGKRIEKGEYPISSSDIIKVAKNGHGEIPVTFLINGMVYVLGCDEKFKYNQNYIEKLKSIDGIENYLILEIEKSAKDNKKRALIYASTLCILNPNKSNLYNRCVILMNIYDETKQDFFVPEIVESLKKITENYPGFIPANFNLGKYYTSKDLDMAKHYLSKCKHDKDYGEESVKILKEIDAVENYDNAVAMVKQGHGAQALKYLITYCNDNPDDPNAKFYTAIALRQSGNFEDALVYLKDLINYGRTANVLSEIALNLASLKKFGPALKYFGEALKIAPDDEAIICNIAVCYLNLGMFDEAKTNFEKAFSLNPDDKIAEEWLNKLKNI